jgi:hypothetical protein
MPNVHVITRLEAIRSVLLSAHKGGTGLSAPVIGSERESFINLVLRNVARHCFGSARGRSQTLEGASRAKWILWLSTQTQ